MKKLLMGSAAAAALFATGAIAQEATVRTQGVFTGGIGYVSVDDNQARAANDQNDSVAVNDVALIRDAEVIFRFELVADNGITFGIRAELETGDGGDNVDENFATVAGSFGRFELGEADGAADAYKGSGIVDYTFASSMDGTGFLFDYYSAESGIDVFAAGNDTGDDVKISYFTPNFSGFSAGVSFVPAVGEGADDVNNSNLTNDTNAFELGAGYSGEFGGFGFDIGGGWTSDTAARTEDDSSFGVGAKVSYLGFQVGVNYGWVEGGEATCSDTDLASGDCEDADTIGVGVAYGTGPWLASVQYSMDLSGPTEDTFGISGDVGYALAPGVTVGAGLEYGDPEASENEDDLDEAFAAGLWIGLNF